MTIKEYCKEHQITMSQLAKDLNVCVSLLSKIDSGRERPSEKMFLKLKALGISYEDYKASDYKSYLQRENARLNDKIRALKTENARLKQIIEKRLNSAVAILMQSDCAIRPTHRSHIRRPKD